MSHLKEDASTAIEAQIKVQQGRWRTAHEEVVEAECRMEELRELLRYVTCPACGSELVGGVADAKEAMLAAKASGRRDGTCHGCPDTGFRGVSGLIGKAGLDPNLKGVKGS